jgi:hypothetical protein
MRQKMTSSCSKEEGNLKDKIQSIENTTYDVAM